MTRRFFAAAHSRLFVCAALATLCSSVLLAATGAAESLLLPDEYDLLCQADPPAEPAQRGGPAAPAVPLRRPDSSGAKARPNANAADERAAVTIHTLPGCPPCERLKRDLPGMSGYRWIVHGPDPRFDTYPRISWISPRTGRRVYIAGRWEGIEWWHVKFMEQPLP